MPADEQQVVGAGAVGGQQRAGAAAPAARCGARRRPGCPRVMRSPRVGQVVQAQAAGGAGAAGSAGRAPVGRAVGRRSRPAGRRWPWLSAERAAGAGQRTGVQLQQLHPCGVADLGQLLADQRLQLLAAPSRALASAAARSRSRWALTAPKSSRRAPAPRGLALAAGAQHHRYVGHRRAPPASWSRAAGSPSGSAAKPRCRQG